MYLFLSQKGKGENIWDHMTHMYDGGIFDNSTGDVAADSYNKQQEDVACLKETGVSLKIIAKLLGQCNVR
jgi:beta-glucosidase